MLGYPGTGLEVPESLVVRGEGVGFVQAVEFLADPTKSSNLVEQTLRIGANATLRVALSKERKMITASGLTHLDRQTNRITRIREVQRHQMVPHQGRNVLAQHEWHPSSPQNLASANRSLPGVASGGDVAVRGDARTERLGDVVQQGRTEQHASIDLRQRTPDRRGGHRLADHMNVRPNITLRVADGMLGNASEIANPVEAIELDPVDRPIWRLWYEWKWHFSYSNKASLRLT